MYIHTRSPEIEGCTGLKRYFLSRVWVVGFMFCLFFGLPGSGKSFSLITFCLLPFEEGPASGCKVSLWTDLAPQEYVE